MVNGSSFKLTLALVVVQHPGVVFVPAAKEASEAAIGASAAANRPSELANAVPRTNEICSNWWHCFAAAVTTTIPLVFLFL